MRHHPAVVGAPGDGIVRVEIYESVEPVDGDAGYLLIAPEGLPLAPGVAAVARRMVDLDLRD